MAQEESTKELLDGRKSTYGNAAQNMDSLADMWNGYVDGVEQRSGKREVQGADVAMMFVLAKAYRFAVAPDYGDNIADVFGYAQIAKDCVGKNMIEAGSAQEYQAKKASPNKPSSTINVKVAEALQEYAATKPSIAQLFDDGRDRATAQNGPATPRVRPIHGWNFAPSDRVSSMYEEVVLGNSPNTVLESDPLYAQLKAEFDARLSGTPRRMVEGE